MSVMSFFWDVMSSSKCFSLVFSVVRRRFGQQEVQVPAKDSKGGKGLISGKKGESESKNF